MGFFHDKKAFDRKWTAGDEQHDEALAEAGVSVEAASRVKGRPTGWLVQDVIPDAAVTLVAGEPGAGKTFLACQLAADAARELKARVLLVTAGYESAELLRWRLDRAEGDSRRVALATLTPRGYTDRRQRKAPPDDLLQRARFLKEGNLKRWNNDNDFHSDTRRPTAYGLFDAESPLFDTLFVDGLGVNYDRQWLPCSQQAVIRQST